MEAKFDLAAQLITDWFKNGGDTNDDNKLALYKFFKQGKVGDCNTEAPGMFAFKEKKKWESWNSVKGKMTKDQAQEEYIKLAKSLLPADKAGQL